MNDEEIVISEDRKTHPNCSYSQSFSQSCHNNKNNEYICETLKRIVRHCPGENSKDIFSSSSSSKDPIDNKKFLNPFDNQIPFGHFDGIVNKDPFGIMDSIFQQIMGSNDIYNNNNEHNNNHNHPNLNIPKQYKPVIPPHKEINNDKSTSDNIGSIKGPIEKV